MSPGREQHMCSPSVAVVGCGDLGLRLAAQLPSTIPFIGLRRNIALLPEDLHAVAVDYTQPASLAVLARLAPTIVIATFKPVGRGYSAYQAGFTRAMQHLLTGLGKHRPRLSLMVSSSRVYAEANGNLVDEGSPLATTDPTALAIIEAERLLLSSGLTASVLRCGGIYGGAGGRLLSRIMRGEVCASEPLRYSNRIHRDDVAGFMAYLITVALEGESVEAVYNVVDSHPASQYEVESWLARQLSVEPVALPNNSSISHKRCSNQRLLASGYSLLYPNYRSGYGPLLAAHKPRPLNH
ncbi:MAG: NAD(P)H-binding protein [Parahaliea sp.]